MHTYRTARLLFLFPGACEFPPYLRYDKKKKKNDSQYYEQFQDLTPYSGYEMTAKTEV